MYNPRVRLPLVPVVVAILLGAAYAMSRQGAWFPAGVFAALAVLTVAFTALSVAPPRRTLTLTAGGVGLSNSPALAFVLAGLLVAAILLPLSLGVLWLTSGTQPTSAAGPLVLLGIVVVCGVPAVVRLFRGGYRLGGLELTPETITYTSYAREHTIAWATLTGIDVHPTLGRLELYSTRPPADRGARALGGGKKLADAQEGPDTQMLAIPPRMLRIDGHQLKALLEYYLEHPRDRHELGDGSALDRTFDRVPG